MSTNTKRRWSPLHLVTWFAGFAAIGDWAICNLRLLRRSDCYRYLGWPVQHGYDFRAAALIIDTVAGIVVVAAIMYAVEKAARRQSFMPRFGLKATFATMTAACYLAMLERERILQWSSPEFYLAIPLYLGLAVAWLVCFDLMGGAWHRIARKRAEATE
jgi:hypothetical protein